MFKRVFKQVLSTSSLSRTKTGIRLQSLSLEQRPSLKPTLGGLGTSLKASTSLEEGFMTEDDQAPMCK
jgi:hypothetical protein